MPTQGALKVSLIPKELKLFRLHFPEAGPVPSTVLGGLGGDGERVGVSSHLVGIYLGSVTFHFSCPQLAISQIIVFPVEIHQAFAAIQDMIWPMPGAN